MCVKPHFSLWLDQARPCLPCMHPCLLAARPVLTAAGWTLLATLYQRTLSRTPSVTSRWSTCFHAGGAASRCYRYEHVINHTSLPPTPACGKLGCGTGCSLAFQYASVSSACRNCPTHPSALAPALMQNLAAVQWHACRVRGGRLLAAIAIQPDGRNPLSCGLSDTMLQVRVQHNCSQQVRTRPAAVTVKQMQRQRHSLAHRRGCSKETLQHAACALKGEMPQNAALAGLLQQPAPAHLNL